MKPENNTENTAGSDCQPRLVSPWVDVTSFSQNAKDRTPRTWRAQFGRFKMTLTRHIYHAPDAWVATCEGVFDRREMASKDVREAARQAKAMLQEELETAINAILGANDQRQATASTKL
jgi:uncharacterized damage-inducible protein DinB